MTRRFRLGLFLSLAAAAGLHIRPCALSMLVPFPSDGDHECAAAEDPILADAASAPRHTVRRPDLFAIAADREVSGARTAAHRVPSDQASGDRAGGDRADRKMASESEFGGQEAR